MDEVFGVDGRLDSIALYDRGGVLIFAAARGVIYSTAGKGQRIAVDATFRSMVLGQVRDLCGGSVECIAAVSAALPEWLLAPGPNKVAAGVLADCDTTAGLVSMEEDNCIKEGLRLLAYTAAAGAAGGACIAGELLVCLTVPAAIDAMMAVEDEYHACLCRTQPYRTDCGTVNRQLWSRDQFNPRGGRQ